MVYQRRTSAPSEPSLASACCCLSARKDGRAVLEFADPFDGGTHSVWVTPEFIELLRT